MPPSLAILCDPLVGDHGPGRVAVLLAQYLSDTYDTELVASAISPEVDAKVRKYGVRLMNLRERFIAKTSSLAFVEAWLKEICFARNCSAWTKGNHRPDIILNLSNSIVTKSDVWYMLGSVSQAIKEITPNLPIALQLGARLSGPIVEVMDSKQVRLSSELSSVHVACSVSCGTSYLPWHVRVDSVIFPPLDTSVFSPSTRNPSEDYCLAYLGKETHFDPILALADAGIRISAFGSKFDRVPRELRSHSQIHFTGLVAESSLVDLYSHAKFTIFPFTTEPFGYVPVESMACGTPVLTYKKQGPSETVVDGETGWLTSGPQEFVKKAIDIWRTGSIPTAMRDACRRQGLKFSVARIGEMWMNLLKAPEERESKNY